MNDINELIKPPVDKASLVARAKNIIMTPKTEWDVIDAEPATVSGIFKNWVLILAALPAIAGFIGSVTFGHSLFGMTYRPTISEALGSAVLQYAGGVVGVYLLALVIDFLAPHFGGTSNREQAMKVSAYSATAGWLAGISAIFPPVSFLGLLGIYSLYLLYLGLPRLMKVPQDKAMGYTVVTIVAVLVLFFVGAAIMAPLSNLF